MASRLIDSAGALAHPARLRILGMLRGGSLCVGQITAVPELAASTVSAHLADLRRAGLVLERKEGRWAKYSLADAREPKAVLELVRLVRGLRRVPVEELCRVGLDVTRLGLTRALG
jgi:DNA-binding transcriptional ArsR family regulator